MTIYNLLRSSLPLALVYWTGICNVQASDSQTRVDSLSRTNRPNANHQTIAQKATIAANTPLVIAVKTSKSRTSTSRKKSKASSPRKTKAAKTTPTKEKVATPEVATATKSLHNPATAQKIDVSKLSFFGPLSMSYRYDPRMIKAAEIAAARAYGHSQGSCWRYVKNALLSAGLVDSRPTSAYAKEAAEELTSKYGFRRISCSDPYKAPLGSVLVYGGGGAGHVEFRTQSGFVSDFTTPRPSKRPLIGVFVK